MLIGELVEKSGMARDTIRFYKKKGLISIGSNSRRKNNYKEYPETVLNKLLLIKKLKNLGFTLSEIDTFFGLWEEKDASCSNVKFTLENKISFVNEQLIKLTELKDTLTSSLQKCNQNNCEFEKPITACSC